MLGDRLDLMIEYTWEQAEIGWMWLCGYSQAAK
jgi:hypothetical protein